MTNKIKEIRILEPKIKEVKKEKPKEDEKPKEEEEGLEGEFLDFDDRADFVEERRRPNLRRMVSTAQQNDHKSLEAKMGDVVVEKNENEGKKDFYKAGSSDFYGDSKKLYTGSGDQKGSGYDAMSPLDPNSRKSEEQKKKKYVLEERRDSNPLDNSNSPEIRRAEM